MWCLSRNVFAKRSISNKSLLTTVALAVGLMLTFDEGYSQIKKQTIHSPGHLRVDLLRRPDAVYKNGILRSLTLEELKSCPADSLEYSTVNSSRPGFSWVLDDGISHQNAYQIRLASSLKDLEAGQQGIWNSGKVISSQSVNVLYAGPALKPGKTYYWSVKIWRNQTESSYAPVQRFTMGATLTDYALPSYVLTKNRGWPVNKKVFGTNNIIYDFGRDGFSQPVISVMAANPDTLTIRLGEKLSADGHIDTVPPGTVRYRQITLPVQKGTQVYPISLNSEKRNTGPAAVKMPAYIGEVLPFRFLEIKGNLNNSKIQEVRREVVHIPFNDQATVFESSDSNLNRVWQLCKYTIKATTFTGYYVDGDRERIPYEADALINQLSHYSSDASFNIAKRTLSYLIDHPTWPTEWFLQNPLIAYNDYMYSGDSRNLKVIYGDLKSKVLTALEDSSGLISTRRGRQLPAFLKSVHYNVLNGEEGLKDIVDWPHTESDGFVFTDYNAVVNAFYYAALSRMATIAADLDLPKDARFYADKARSVKQAFVRHFINTKTGLILDGIGTQHSSLHANMFAMAFGLVPASNYNSVLNFIKSRGLACSVYGAQFLLEALGQQDTTDYALRLLTSSGKRSWINMLREGATMTMEAWGQQFKPNQDWNHAWGTAPANYIVRHLMGIQPLKPGFAQTEIKPHPAGLDHARIQYATIRGDILVSFRQHADTFNLQVNIPGNTVAEVYLPFTHKQNVLIKMNGKRRKADYTKGYWRIENVPSGHHEFTIQAN